MTAQEVWTSDRELSDLVWLSPDMGDAHSLPVAGKQMAVWAHRAGKIPGQIHCGNETSRTSFNDFWMPSVLHGFAGQAGGEIAFELEMHDPSEVVSWGI